MRSVDYWQRRLDTARREARDADRVWQDAMARDAAHRDPWRNVHVLWRERENARARVIELQQVVLAAQRRRSRWRPRSRRHVSRQVAFLAWHLATRFERLR